MRELNWTWPHDATTWHINFLDLNSSPLGMLGQKKRAGILAYDKSSVYYNMGSIIPYTNLNNLLFRGLFKIRPFFGTCELSLCKEGAELERFGPAWMHESPRRSSSQTNKEGNHETIDPHSIGSTDSCPNYES